MIVEDESNSGRQEYTYDQMGGRVGVCRTHAEQLCVFIWMHEWTESRDDRSQHQDDLVDHILQKFSNK